MTSFLDEPCKFCEFFLHEKSEMMMVIWFPIHFHIPLHISIQNGVQTSILNIVCLPS